MVGTHVPDERDQFQSALQRMREAFLGLLDGSLSPEVAQEEFLSSYVAVADMSAGWFLTPRD